MEVFVGDTIVDEGTTLVVAGVCVVGTPVVDVVLVGDIPAHEIEITLNVTATRNMIKTIFLIKTLCLLQSILTLY